MKEGSGRDDPLNEPQQQTKPDLNTEEEGTRTMETEQQQQGVELLQPVGGGKKGRKRKKKEISAKKLHSSIKKWLKIPEKWPIFSRKMLKN